MGINEAIAEIRETRLHDERLERIRLVTEGAVEVDRESSTGTFLAAGKQN